MSYFVFGLADLDASSKDGEGEGRAKMRMEQCAAEAGIAVAVGDDRGQTILAEMRDDFVAGTSVPFLLLKEPEHDTSEQLIAPDVGGIEGMIEGTGSVADWARCILRQGGISRVRIWFTEGWDDAFESRECWAEELAATLERRVRDEMDVPSMLFSVRQR